MIRALVALLVSSVALVPQLVVPPPLDTGAADTGLVDTGTVETGADTSSSTESGTDTSDTALDTADSADPGMGAVELSGEPGGCGCSGTQGAPAGAATLAGVLAMAFARARARR